MMRNLFSLFVVALCGSVALSADYLNYKEHGFGVQKLRNSRLQRLQGSLQQSTSCENVEQFWFKDAIVDNFAPIEQQQTWANEGQRYWMNKQFWGGEDFPIFVFIGGEGEESCTRLTDHMYLFDLAQEHQALLIDVEHRFYGQSYPTPDMSTENLQYLSSEQALADLARIITFVKKDVGSPNSQVMTVGGSYPGNMAAWFRLKYPSVSHASIASSAPVVAQTNFPEYMDVVAQSIIYYSGQQCVNQIETAANIVSKLGAGGPGSPGMKKLEKDFATCSSIESEADYTIMLSDLMGNVQGTIQYNNEHNGVMNVTDICATMLENGGESQSAYSNFVQLQAQYRAANGQECEDASWADTVAYLANPEKDNTNAGRPWTYQTCNEFGYFQTTDSKNQPFHSWTSINLDFSRALCAAAFSGWTSDPQVDWINTAYGGLAISGTNILFPSGTIDPWHALGVTNYTKEMLPESTEQALYIEGTAHCNDLYAPASSDSSYLTNARNVVRSQVAAWFSV